MKEELNNIDRIKDELLHVISVEDKQLLDEWTNSHPEHSEFHKLLNNIRVSPEVSAIGNEMKDDIYQDVQKRISTTIRRQLWLKLSSAVAAIILLFSVSNYYFYQKGYKEQQSQLIEMVNPLGVRSSITLPDGTKVTLNAGSTLKYPSAFVHQQREVEVEGEAYFEVAPNKAHPFVVKVNDINIKVLGTSFNIKAYQEEEEIEVTLVEGKVCIEYKDLPELPMQPGQQVSYLKQSNSFSKQEVNPLNYVSWKEGKFYFEKNTLEQVARQLERSFNVNINITTTELRTVVFTGDFIRGENLEQILRVITADKRIGYQIKENQVLIFNK